MSAWAANSWKTGAWYATAWASSAGVTLTTYSGVSFPKATSFHGVSQPTVSSAGVITHGVSAMKADGVIKAEFLVNGALP